ncbi:hypothetical protein WBJ53_01255 [Spirosoma sp. SC4-14]|uniref:hypothetical protein n=1 Tax=Spirosoma sp. SC4-14 TaxID=3128900 RepID=UPI0030CE5D87
MIRYTSKTIGDESPLYTEQSYSLSAYDYFFRFFKILLAFLLVQMIVLAWIIAKEAIRPHQPLLFLCTLCFTGFAAYFCFIFYFDWQYWTITKNVCITLNPHTPSIIISSPDQTSFLTPSNVVRIEHHLRKTENSKDPLGGYGFFLFYDTNQNVVQLNNIFLIHVEFLARFFKDIPQTIVWHTYPWVAYSDQIKVKRKNLASHN